jgi:hypothetical protein
MLRGFSHQVFPVCRTQVFMLTSVHVAPEAYKVLRGFPHPVYQVLLRLM